MLSVTPSNANPLPAPKPIALNTLGLTPDLLASALTTFAFKAGCFRNLFTIAVGNILSSAADIEPVNSAAPGASSPVASYILLNISGALSA